MEDKEENKKPLTQQITIRVPDNIGHGAYANIVSINASDNEVILDFVLNVPSNGQAILTSRVIISPTTAQQLSDLLEALLRAKDKVKKEQAK